MKRKIPVSIMFALCLLLFACKGRTDLDSNQIPKKLKIGISISTEDPQEAYRRYESLVSHLEGELGIKVELVKTTSYAPAIEALKSKKLHMSSMGPFAFLIARQKMGLQPLITMGYENGFPRANTSVIVTHKSSPIKTVEALKEHAKELTISFVDPASTSGHIIQRHYLRSIGIEPERDFKNVLFSTNHLASALTVINGKVDVACMGMTSIIRLSHTRDDISPDAYNILWKSEPIPSNVYAIRDDIDPAFREKVRMAFLSYKDKDPEGFALRVENYRKYYGIETDSMNYVTATNAFYDKLESFVNEDGVLEELAKE
jgi:phosphonate transport system substrate-binding protein